MWAATCKDKRYIKLKGLQTTALMEEHKKEVVAGNLGAYIGAGQFTNIGVAGAT